MAVDMRLEFDLQSAPREVIGREAQLIAKWRVSKGYSVRECVEPGIYAREGRWALRQNEWVFDICLED